MGANATTFVPSYTSGEVLTAANLSVTNSGIPVFATTVTRDAAFGGTGEKTLAEGQFAYIEATNTTQYYDGAAWQSVGATPGLAFVLAQTVGTAVSSVTVSSAFSATYDTYKIVYSGGNVSTGLNLQMTIGGISTATYENSYIQGNTRNTTLNNVGTGPSATFFTIGVGVGPDYGPDLDLNIYSPFLAKYTNISGWSNTVGSNGTQTLVGGTNRTASSVTSFAISTSTGTLTGGVISVYGYTKA
jgi:hypothetical protein